ncbi:hypothetical protein [Streptomyces sp. NPDC047042]|uniref:hypothetical protein n=1 Tax=Streptomyces sp. NPDC047042 TaxID=3154807 RepID=UPI0033C88123
MEPRDDGKIPATMRAVVLTGHGGLDTLVYRRTDVPTPTAVPTRYSCASEHAA